MQLERLLIAKEGEAWESWLKGNTHNISKLQEEKREFINQFCLQEEYFTRGFLLLDF